MVLASAAKIPSLSDVLLLVLLLEALRAIKSRLIAGLLVMVEGVPHIHNLGELGRIEGP